MALELSPAEKASDVQYETEVSPLPIGLLRCIVAIALLAGSLPGVVVNVGTFLLRVISHHDVPPREKVDSYYEAIIRQGIPYSLAENLRHLVLVTRYEVLGVTLGFLFLFNGTAKKFFRILLSRRYLRPPT